MRSQTTAALPSFSLTAKFLLALLLLLLLGQLPGWAELPTGYNPALSSGVSSVRNQGTIQTITTGAPRSLGSFNTFNIGKGYQVNVNQPGASSAFMAQVRNVGAPSTITGTLNSNGAVGIINPAGVFVGPGGIVNTQGGFLATTQRLNEQQFLNGGAVSFSNNPASSTSASVQNYGNITVGDRGFILLAAPTVVNHPGAVLNAPDGQINLLSARQFALQTADGVRLNLVLPTTDVANNSFSDGAFTGIVNNAGKAVTNKIGTNYKGEIILKSVGGAVRNTGSLINYSDGGNTRLQGKNVDLIGGEVKADGTVLLIAEDKLLSYGVDMVGNNVTLQNTGQSANAANGIRLGGPYNGGFSSNGIITAQNNLSITSNNPVEIADTLAAANLNVAANNGSLRLYPTANVTGRQSATLYAAGDIFLNGNGASGDALRGARVASGGDLKVASNRSVSLDRGALLTTYKTATTADKTLEVGAGETLTNLGLISSQAGNVSLGAGNKINITPGARAVSETGNVSLGAGKLVQVDGEVGSVGGAVSLGAGETVLVNGSAYAVEKTISAGAGDAVIINGLLTNANGDVILGAKNLVAVNGNTGTANGKLSIGSGDRIDIRGKAGSANNTTSLGSGGSITIENGGEVGSGNGDVELGSAGTISIKGFAGSGKGKVSAGSGTDIIVDGYLGSGENTTTAGAGNDVVINGFTGSGTGNVELGAGRNVVISGTAGSSQGGSTSIGAGNDVIVNQSGVLGSNNGRLTIGVGRDVNVYGQVGTDTSSMRVDANRNVLIGQTGSIGSNAGATDINAYTGKVRVDGTLASSSGNITVRSAGAIERGPNANLNSGSGTVFLQEDVQF